MAGHPGTLKLPAGQVPYEAHRARALVLAARGRALEALDELNEGWTEEWPFPAVYATDVARVRFLAGQYAEAIEALHLAVRGAEHAEPEVPALARECVRNAPEVWRRALRLALAGGTASQRARTAWSVLRARL